MKKFLSLVLALVMTMSLVTVSAGAKDFADDSDIDYKAAVDVISELGVVDGYSDDTFRPDGLLTRGAAAKIICNLILGPTTASALSASTAPFRDVPTTNTFAGYITYCAQQGIISGYGDGTFRPTGTLSGNAFMKMLLGALGYDSSIEHYTGANWQVNVIKQAVGIGLEDGNDNFVGSNPVTRGEAALYAFNMLQATMVEYDTQSTIVVGDVQINTSSSRDEVSFSGIGVGTDGNIELDGYVQFAERYFEDLEKDAGDEDAFGRPADRWTLDGEEIGTYVTEEPVVTYTEETDRSDVRSDLRSYDYANGLNATVNGGRGAAVDSYSDVAALTADGTIVEVYTTSGDVDTVVVVETDYAEVTSVNDNRETFTISYNGTTEVIDDDSDFYGLYGQVEEDDILVISYDSSDEVLDLYIPETVTGEITYVNRNGDTATVGGTDVTAAATAGALFTGTLDEDSVVYLNEAGFAVYVDAATSSSADYAFVTDMWREAGTGINQGTTKIYAQVVYTDGTVETIEIANNNASSAYNATQLANLGFTDLANSSGSLTVGTSATQAYPGPGNGTVSHPNTVLEYTESTEDSGVYMLTVPDVGNASTEGVTADSTTAVSSSSNRIGSVYMSSDVAFVYVDGTGDDVRTSVGEKAAINAGTHYQAVVEEVSNRHLATVVFVQGGSAASDDVLYISDVRGSVRYTDADGATRTGTRVEYYAYGESEPDTMIVSRDGATPAVGFFTIAAADGEANELRDYNIRVVENTAVGTDDMYNGYIIVSGTEYDLNDALIVDTTDNGLESVSALENAIEQNDQTVYVSFTHSTDGDVEIIYVQDVKSTETGIREVILTNTVTNEVTYADINGTAITASVVAGTYEVTVDPVDNDAEVYISFDNGASWQPEGVSATTSALTAGTSNFSISIWPATGIADSTVYTFTVTVTAPAP